MPMPRAWKLCTRTFAEDYFWIDQSLNRTADDDLYLAIADDSNHRCGYLYSDGRRVRTAIGRLDADRADRGNRPIRHILCLSADVHDAPAVETVRDLFSEALADPTPMAPKTAAAAMARALFARWDQKTKGGPASDTPDLWPPSPAASVRVPPTAPPLIWGRQYRRDQGDFPVRLAATVAADLRQPCLIAVAATKSAPRLMDALRRQTDFVAVSDRIIVCSLTADHDRTLPTTIGSPHAPMFSASPRIRDRPWWALFRVPLILLTILLLALLGWLTMTRSSSSPTAVPSIDTPEPKTLPALSPAPIPPTSNDGSNTDIMGKEKTSAAPAAVDRLESPTIPLTSP